MDGEKGTYALQVTPPRSGAICIGASKCERRAETSVGVDRIVAESETVSEAIWCLHILQGAVRGIVATPNSVYNAVVIHNNAAVVCRASRAARCDRSGG